MDSSRRTMSGFTWLTDATPQLGVLTPSDEDLWCVRDAICQLMRWAPGSDDYRAFIRLPGKQDTYRLATHLGLALFDYDNQSQIAAEHATHPGVMLYELDVPGAPSSNPVAHMIYEPDLRRLRGIPPQYDEYRPKLVLVLVDMNQSPHVLGLRSALTSTRQLRTAGCTATGTHNRWHARP